MDVKALREIHRKERMHAKLQDVGKDFYGELEAAVRDLYSKYMEHSKKGGISRASILLGELENVKAVIRDLYEIRERKIVLSALNYARRGGEIEVENLTQEEERLLKSIIRLLKENRKILEEIVGEKPVIKTPAKEKKQEKLDFPLLTVRILKELPPIVGIDGKVYGAFKAEDIATLPEPNAIAFINQGVAEKVELKIT
jgi:DNA replication initiation complex subunit (GINS family)